MLFASLLLYCLALRRLTAFQSTRLPFMGGISRFRSNRTFLRQTTSSEASLLDDIRAKSVRELKQELDALKISTKDALEKEDLVQRLYVARKVQSKTPGTSDNAIASNILTVPLLMSSLEHDIPVSAGNVPGQQGWTFSPTEQRHCLIQVDVHQNGRTFPLSLLLDTACSGIVLRPEVGQRHNMRVVTSPVTMTSAGGTSTSNSQVTTLESFSLRGNSLGKRFGPLPASLQDIETLPRAVDGIIGLSFLNRFHSVEFDFVAATISFFETDPPPPSSELQLIGQGDLKMLGSLGIYAVDTWWGGRGPVRMLLDTGSAGCFWSWKGVTQDLQIQRDSPIIQRLPGVMGVIGSDNTANPLTHRINVSSRMRLKDGKGLGLSDRRLGVDIGEIPILQHLQPAGIGGILGLDLLRGCSVVRFRCQGTRPYLRLYEARSE